MEIDIAAAAVVRGQVEDDVDVPHDIAGDTGLTQVRLDELDSPGVQVALDVFDPPAAEVVHHAHARASLNQFVDNVGADERSAARHERRAAIPLPAQAPSPSIRCAQLFYPVSRSST